MSAAISLAVFGAQAGHAAVELVSYLALNPGADHHAIDDALWPGRRVNKEMKLPLDRGHLETGV